jgi:L-fucose isomerase-like protein
MSFWPVVHTLSPEFEKAISDNCILSGGCFASLAHTEPVNDFDLWCKDELGMEIIESFLEKFQGNDYSTDKPMVCENPNYSNNFVDGKIVTARATTLINKLQFIKNVKYIDAKKSFDFLHCTPHYDCYDDKLYISYTQMESISDKTLVVNNENAVTIYRMQKFKDRGWK